jgi:hypothetical protein
MYRVIGKRATIELQALMAARLLPIADVFRTINVHRSVVIARRDTPTDQLRLSMGTNAHSSGPQ